MASIGAASALALPLRAQPFRPLIGFLHSVSADLYADRVRAFHKGLSETGHVEGRNITVEYRWAGGLMDRLPRLADDLVRGQVSVIATGGIAAVQAARAATATIPIVFQVGADPVELGLVTSLNRPGGNLTGVTTMNVELGPKRLELLREVVPTATTIALLINPSNPNSETLVRDLQTAGLKLGVHIPVLQASEPRDFDAVFAKLKDLRSGALVIGTDGMFVSRSKELGALSARHGIPAIFQYREFPEAGGLMSYGGDFAEAYRQVGIYTGRILKGEKAAELPVQQVTAVELIINLKSANALGLRVPLPLLGRASHVIE